MADNSPNGPVDTVSVVGIGKLGAPISACFAHKGYNVIAVDVNPEIVDTINDARAPVFEPGLDNLIQANRERLTATADFDEAVKKSRITFIIVPTPSDPDGAFTTRYAVDAAGRIGDALRDKSEYHLVVMTSTVLPGATCGEVLPVLESRSGKKCGEDFGLCYNPEFIALGSVIRDVLNPDFVLVGQSDPRAGEMLKAFYEKLSDNNAPVALMNIINAEITKLSVNTFVTTKITFANMVARICERLPGADVDVVTAALGLDARIGGKYLKGATGYGGPCFPRDNVALSYLARKIGAPAFLAEATDSANRREVEHLAELVKSKMPDGGQVGILGLTYKPDTDVVEESQGLLLAQKLVDDGVKVMAYDPKGMKNAVKAVKGDLDTAESVDECVKKSDAIVIVTPWKQFEQISPDAFGTDGPRKTVVDCWRLLDSSIYRKIVDYIALGVGGENSG